MMINGGVGVFSGVDNPATLCDVSTSENPLLILCQRLRFVEGNWDAARNLWGTISEELETLEIMGDVATGAGLGVREFYPDSKKNENFMRGWSYYALLQQ